MSSLEVLAEGVNLGGKYQISRLLAEEPHRNVYLARDSVEFKTWRVTQAAVPTDEAARREFMAWFYAEGERVSAVLHPQIPLVGAFFLERGCAWTTVEHVQGETLRKTVENDASTSEDRLRTWLLDVITIVEALHAQEMPLILGSYDADDFQVPPHGKLRLLEYPLARLFPPTQRAPLLDEGADPDPSAHADVMALGRLGLWLRDRAPGDAVGTADDEPAADASAATVEILERCLRGPGEGFSAIAEVRSALLKGNSPPPADPPRMEIVPEQLAITHASPDGGIVSGFHVANSGGGVLSVDVQTSAPWLQVSPEHFESNDQQVQVWVDAEKLGDVDAAEGIVTVKSEVEERTVPVRLEMQSTPWRRIPIALALLVMLVLALAPTAGVVYVKWQGLQQVRDVMRPGSSDARRLEPLQPYMRNVTRLQLLVGLLAPLALFGFYRVLSASNRLRLNFVLVVGLFTPIAVTFIVFRDMTVPVPPSMVSLHPQYGLVLLALTNVVVGLMLLLPANRWPGMLAERPDLRFWLAIALLVVYARMLLTL